MKKKATCRNRMKEVWAMITMMTSSLTWRCKINTLINECTTSNQCTCINNHMPLTLYKCRWTFSHLFNTSANIPFINKTIILIIEIIKIEKEEESITSNKISSNNTFNPWVNKSKKKSLNNHTVWREINQVVACFKLN
jgi:hypothetical protein